MSKQPILFVDDDLISRLLNGAILRESGFEVLEARSFAEACRVIDQHPDLLALVTDIDLGAAAGDGFEVARRARAARADVPVIYISGTEFPRYAREGVADSRFVPKPFQPSQIVRALDDAPLAPMHLDVAGQARN